MAPVVVAVVPFGARAAGSDGDAGAAKRSGVWAREIARRVVERFAGDSELELRPVFLVAMPDTAAEAGYLVMGSTPDPKLAVEYARSLDAAYVLTGTYREAGGRRRLEATLVEVAGERVAAAFDRELPEGELHLAEPALAAWLARAVGARTGADLSTPAVASETAYAALLEGMDAEVDATLVRSADPGAARSATASAARAYARAAREDLTSAIPEERLLVLAATAIERDEQSSVLEGLETLSEARPASWRAHYILGEVRRTAGDVGGAIVAFEHADALQPLRDSDALLLARLYVMAGAGATATARLRRIIRTSRDLATVAAARRLDLSVRHPELERTLEEAGRLAVEGDVARAAEADAGIRRVLAVEPDIWEAHFGLGLLARQRGDAKAAASSFRRARELNPASASLLTELEASDAEA